jgi:putative restriction endonuclease
MRYLILESREQTGYGDSDLDYEFPKQYLKHFSGVSSDHPVLALIYEPRRAGDRQAFVGWAQISSPPEHRSINRWHVAFEGGIRSFDQPVPRRIDGIPTEHWLRDVPSKQHGSRLQGKSVRPINAANAMEVLQMGAATFTRVRLLALPTSSSVELRARKTISVLARSAGFRDTVLTAYRYRCAITGLTGGRLPASRLAGALEVAHIRPVAESGPDELGNGLVLTPTLHRLFDAGFFTLRAKGHQVTVRRSRSLDEGMLVNRERGTCIRLETGMPLLLPDSASMRPHDDFLKFHQANVFESAA